MDAWIAPENAHWFSMTSLTAVLAALAIFVRRGEHRMLVQLVWGAAALAGLASLIATIIGMMIGQPWWVLTALGVPGVVLTWVYGWATLTLDRAYSESEHRRTLAKDL